MVQFTDSLASLRLLSTSSLAIVPRDISPLSIAADTSASVATGTLAIAIFTCARRTKSVRIRLRSFKMLKMDRNYKERKRKNTKFESFPFPSLFLHDPSRTKLRCRITRDRIMDRRIFLFFFFHEERESGSSEREREEEGRIEERLVCFFFIETRKKSKVLVGGISSGDCTVAVYGNWPLPSTRARRKLPSKSPVIIDQNYHVI